MGWDEDRVAEYIIVIYIYIYSVVDAHVGVGWVGVIGGTSGGWRWNLREGK